MRIDVHSHYLPAAYLAALRDGGGPAMAKPHDDATLIEMIERQDAGGIDRQILSTGPNSPYLRDAGQAAAAARLVNDAYAQAVDRHAGRFGAFGSLPLPHAEAAVAEAVRCLDDLGFAGLHMGCSALGTSLDDPCFEALWQELDARDAIIFLHPGGIVAGTEPGMAGMDDSHIAVTIGSAAEMAVVTLRLAALCTRYRRIRPIIGLLGGSLPSMLQRVLMIVGKWPLPSVLNQFGSADDLMTELQRFHYDINFLPDPEALVVARRVYGVDRLLFGSDAPGGGSIEATLQFMAAAGLDEAERELILSRNAQALFAK